MIALPGCAGNTPRDLEALIETHVFPYTSMDLAAPIQYRQFTAAAHFLMLHSP